MLLLLHPVCPRTVLLRLETAGADVVVGVASGPRYCLLLCIVVLRGAVLANCPVWLSGFFFLLSIQGVAFEAFLNLLKKYIFSRIFELCFFDFFCVF